MSDVKVGPARCDECCENVYTARDHSPRCSHFSRDSERPAMSEPLTREQIEEALADFDKNVAPRPEYWSADDRLLRLLARAVREVMERKHAARKCLECRHVYTITGWHIPDVCTQVVEHRGKRARCGGAVVDLIARPWGKS